MPQQFDREPASKGSMHYSGGGFIYFEIYSVDILNMLGRRYGYDTPMDYIGEDWGTEACKITPREMINMHEMLGWTQEGYRVRIMGPANGALVNKNGITLVQFSF